jgi:uncharacterized protein YdeI (YjbR/CyaY-like superfamily)
VAGNRPARSPVPVFFASRATLRTWFEEHHAEVRELWIGFYKKGSGRSGVSYDDAVEESLCFGWIDGIVKRVDELRYMHRFSPRTPRSPWSKLNVERARRLEVEGRMHPAGWAALERRTADRTGIYAYERRPKVLDRASLDVLRGDAEAWEFYQRQTPSYRRTVAHWVLSGKRPETRERRIRVVLRASRARRRIDQLAPGSSV